VNLFPGGAETTDGRVEFWTEGHSLEVNSITDFFSGYPVPKYTNLNSAGAQGSHPTFPDTDYPMFRLADAYLMYAEVVARGGGGSLPQAVGYVNALRERAYGGPGQNIGPDDLTLDFILDERARELYWEGHRRTDLIRFGVFTGGERLWSWKGNVQTGQSTPDHLDLYPIPASEILANPNLIQNPGY
jgi:hypothetical protein